MCTSVTSSNSTDATLHLTDEQQLQQQELVAALLQTLTHQSPGSSADLANVPAFLLSDDNPATDDVENNESDFSNSHFLRCPCCTYSATDADDLDVHALGEHEDICTFDCKHCSFSTDRWDKYSRHIAKHVLVEKTYTCSLCSYRSKTKGSYDAHMRTHTGEKPYACSYCPYRSSQRVHLKIHVRTHTGEKPFACPNCPYQATQNSSLKRHIQTQHPATPKVSRRYNKYTSAMTATISSLPSVMSSLVCGTKKQQQSEAAQQHFRQLLQQHLHQFLTEPTISPSSALTLAISPTQKSSDKVSIRDKITGGNETEMNSTIEENHDQILDLPVSAKSKGENVTKKVGNTFLNTQKTASTGKK